MVVTEAEIGQFVGQYLWPLFRIASFFMAVPVLGSRLINAKARMALAVMVTLLVVPLLPAVPAVDPISIQGLLIVLQQVVIGVSMGFILQVVMQVFVLAGQFIAMKMGLGFASMNDPSNGVSVTVISQFYLMMATLLFLSVNAHLLIIDLLVQSFRTLPVGGEGVGVQVFFDIAGMGSWMFGSAMVIALPLLTSLLVVNLAFGVMSRAAPQMNVFAVGFPITLVFGLILIWFGLASFLPNYNTFLAEGMAMVKNVLGVY
mgnify:CR=1 FL=1